MKCDRLLTTMAVVGLYAITMAVGLASAWRYTRATDRTWFVAPIDPSLGNLLIFVVALFLFTFVAVRFARVANTSLFVLLVLALAAGTQFIFALWVPWPYDLAGAISVVALMIVVPLVLIHDLAVALGIAGVATVLGLGITPLVACVMLAAMSVYDIISVYRTRHMVALAGRMMASGAVFGFLVPGRWSGFFTTRRRAIGERAVMMLGSGDIGLPLVLATSAVSTSLPSAVTVGAFSLIGVAIMQWLFAHQKRPSPMAALPPIATMAILGYIFAVLFNL